MLFRAKNFIINKKSVHLEASILSRIVSIGMASLIVQLSIVVIIAVNNNLLSKYGYETFASTGVAFGSVISSKTFMYFLAKSLNMVERTEYLMFKDSAKREKSSWVTF